MNAIETTTKPSKDSPPNTSNHRADKAAREVQAQGQTEAEPKKGRSRTRGNKHRPPAKKDRLVELLRRKDGATIEELMDEFGWQAHTVRGAISIAAKRLSVTAERVEKGRYRLPAA
jgi:hypothetical protein